jgi:apolipoprotein N-acyltransferase
MPPSEQLLVAAVQGGIPQNHKWDRAFEEEIMAVYEQETRLLLQTAPDLVIWPEAATPGPLLNDQKVFSQVHRLLQEGHCDLLTGSLYYQETPPRDYNAAILLSPSDQAPQIYAKTHLVPFGEYIPCRKTFPLFAWIVGQRILGDFDAGPGPKVLKLSTHPISLAPLICFEDTLGDLVRGFAGKGAQLLVTLTNDGWFGHTIASQQHAMNALLRAAETKLPLLRVANTGVTCLIDRYGRPIQVLRDAQGSTFEKGVLLSRISVPRHPIPTFYTKHGDWFSYLCLALMIAALLSRILRRDH